MDKSFNDRLVEIVVYLYAYNGEFVHDVSNDECHLHLSGARSETLNFEELNCLIYNEIIEHDTGNNEEGYETDVYVLTSGSKKIISAIIKDNKRLLLKGDVKNP